MLMITTTVGMLDGIHSNTTNLGPAVALYAELMVTAASLKHRLFGTTPTRDLADGSTAIAADNLFASRGQLDTGDVSIGVVGNNDGVVTRASSHGATVTSLLLNIADDGTFRHLTDRLDVTDGQCSTLSAVNILTSVGTLGGNEELLVFLVANGVSEFHLGKGSTTARVVKNLGHDTADVSVAFSCIQSAELSSSLSVGVVGFEDGPTALTL